ncbi:MAG: hypothetical protein WBB69_03500 [Anaerolineales bacterium]
MRNKSTKQNKWIYPVLYTAFLIISMLPLYTEIPYSPQETQDVIVNLLKVVLTPYKAYGLIFHVLTLLLIVLIVWQPEKMGRIWAGYMGLNYLIIALVQTMGLTVKYGFVLHTGGMVMNGVLGLVWLAVAFRNDLQPSFQSISWQHLILIPLALLAFWGPYVSSGSGVQPDFNPLLLLTSPDYGLTFCFTTPVFLFLLILFYPQVNILAYRITAFNGLLYGLYNLSHWFNPELRWMGFLHLPLLIISAYALALPQIYKKQEAA